MTAPDPHERFDELAAGYALYALEPADEQVFRAHLAGCPDCQRAIAEHTETLSHLAYAAAPAELPPSLLEGIRGEVAGTAREQEPAPVSLDAARHRRRPSAAPDRSWVAAAAAVALVLALGGWNIALRHDRSQSDLRAQRLAGAVATLEQGAKQVVRLNDTDGRPVAAALVRADNTVSLVVDGLAPNDRSSSTYVLWQKTAAGGVRAVGAFDVRGRGVDVVPALALPSDAGGLAGFAVTREPGRHAPSAPGSRPVADGALPA
ncbi:MAG: hypothetical protein QOE99_571 [Actinomycetota bacterium]|nr:hypothetical protein [Actinomycetota bacterium]